MRVRLDLTAIPSRAGLRTRQVGHALLVHRKGEPDPGAVALAATLAPDPPHRIVVADLPADARSGEWDALGRLLAVRSGGVVRLVFGRGTPAGVRRIGQAVADRTGGAVLAADGTPRPVPGGGLFVPHDRGSGWLRFQQGRPPTADSRRFPKPHWEYTLSETPWTPVPGAVVEPTAGGLWLRSADDTAGSATASRHWLVDRIPGGSDSLTAVLGSPGGPPVELSAAVRVWHSVLSSARPFLRFLQLGPVILPEGVDSLGQGLADAVGEPVVFYTGLPAVPHVRSEAPHIEVPNRDGTAAWRPFAGELVFAPSGEGTPAPPTLLGIRPPVSGAATADGVYPYTDETVLEVIQSGLWLRPTAEPDDADRVRRAAAAPGRAAILYHRVAGDSAERMRRLAEDMLRQLDPALREAFRIGPADAPGAALGWGDVKWWAQADGGARGNAPGPAHGRLDAPSDLPAQATSSHLAPATATAPASEPVTTSRPTAGSATAENVLTSVNGGVATAGSSGAVGGADVSGGNGTVGGAGVYGGNRAGGAAESTGTAGTVTPVDPATWRSALPADPGAAPAAPTPSPPLDGERTATDGDPAGPTRAAPPGGPHGPGDSSVAGASGPDGAPPDGSSPLLPTGPGGLPGAAYGHDGSDSVRAQGSDPVHQRDDGQGADRVRSAERPSPARRPAVLDLDFTPSAGGTPAGPGSTPPTDFPPPPAPPPRRPSPLPTPTGPGRPPVPEPTPESSPFAPGRPPSPAVPTAPPAPAPGPPTPASAPSEPGPGQPPSPAVPTPPPAPAPGQTESSPAGPDRAPAPAAAPTRIRLESGPARAVGAPEGTAAPAPVPANPAPAQERAVPAPAPDVRVQPVPAPAASAVPTGRGLAQERAWLRKTFSTQYDALSGSVARVMSESPGLQGISREDAAAALTDLVAVRLYLSGDSARVDAAVRQAKAGPHVPLARCVSAGLQRLPSYRGPALLRAPMEPAELAWYEEGRVATEWAFCTTQTTPYATRRPAVDVLLWSMTARRTRLVDTSRPDQVVFVPGTVFKVLRRDEGDRPVLLLREVSTSETAPAGPRGSDGTAPGRRVPLDDMALDGLSRALDLLRTHQADSRGAGTPVLPPGAPPGLLPAASPPPWRNPAGPPATGGGPSQ